MEGGVAKKYEKLIDLLDKMNKEGSYKETSWGDNTGHVIVWIEFDSVESFSRLWSLDEFHKHQLERTPLVDNMRIRLLRPARTITDDVIPY